VLCCGPVRGPSHPCKRCNQGHQGHGSVVSVQVVRTVHKAVLLIIRRSWVRAPPAPPAVLLCLPVEPWTGHIEQLPSGSWRAKVYAGTDRSPAGRSASARHARPSGPRRSSSATEHLTGESSASGWQSFKIKPRENWCFDSRVFGRERRQVDISDLRLLLPTA
jgi:hypothetical protein